MHTIIEPFKIKMVEPIKLTTRTQRDAILRVRGDAQKQGGRRDDQDVAEPTETRQSPHGAPFGSS